MKQSQLKFVYFGKSLISFMLFIVIITPEIIFAQCQPYISIDGENTSASTAALPIWLHAGQTLGMNEAVPSVSVLEFTVNGNSLEFSQVLSITSLSTVPVGKVWKIESMVITPLIGNVLNNITYTSSGTFKVPSCTNFICIEVWGAGGGGGNCVGCSSNQGGGGGGYGAGCYTVTPGSSINVTVGAGGSATLNGGTTSVGSLISATGGAGGESGTTGLGGAGGSSTAYIQITGGSGIDGSATGQGGKAGGAGANGGAGGLGGGSSGPTAGTAPGGGGASGANVNNSTYSGRLGARGEVKISW